MTEQNPPPNDGLDDLDALMDRPDRNPQVQYIARMPTPANRGAGRGTGQAEQPTAATPTPAYVRPAVAGDEPPRSGPRRDWNGFAAPLAIILVSLTALAIVFLMTQGGDDRQAARPTPPAVTTPNQTPTPSETPSEAPTASSAAPSSASTASSSAPSTSSSPSPTSTSTSPTSVPLPAGVKVCAAGVGAGETTTCGFATNVAAAVRSARPASGSFQVRAYSSTTKKDYTLSCRAAPVTVCTGGRAAVIYVTG